MRDTHPTSLSQELAATYDADRNRGVDLRNAHRRALDEPRLVRLSGPARVAAAVMRVVRGDRHPMTGYPCRLPGGEIGRTAAVQVDGEWMLVCQVA